MSSGKHFFIDLLSCKVVFARRETKTAEQRMLISKDGVGLRRGSM